MDDDLEHEVIGNRMGLIESHSITSSMEDRAFADMLGTDTATDMTEYDLRHMGVCERLYYSGCEREKARQEKLRAERENKIMEELSQVTSRPAITRRATKLPSKGATFADHATLWHDKMISKRAEAQERLHEEEARDATFSPQINNSRVHIQNHHGPISGWDMHFAKFCSKKNVGEVNQLEFRPNINESSRKSMVGESDVSTRLYSEAQRKKEKQAEAVLAEEQRSLRDPETGLPYFRPVLKDTHLRDPSSVSEELYSQHNTMKMKKQELVEKYENINKNSFHPSIDSRSATMMSNVSRRPLYSPSRGRSFNGAVENSAERFDNERPVRKVNVNKFLNRTEHSNNKKQQRLILLKQQMAAKEARECTFSPRVSPASEKIFDNSLYSGRSNSRQDSGSNPHLVRSPSQNKSQNGQTPHYVAEEPPAYHQGNQQQPIRHYCPPPNEQQPEYKDPYQQPPMPPSQRDYPGDNYNTDGVPKKSEVPNSSGTGHGVEQYISSFEKEMFAMLDQWKKLEEV